MGAWMGQCRPLEKYVVPRNLYFKFLVRFHWRIGSRDYVTFLEPGHRRAVLPVLAMDHFQRSKKTPVDCCPSFEFIGASLSSGHARLSCE